MKNYINFKDIKVQSINDLLDKALEINLEKRVISYQIKQLYYYLKNLH